MSKKAFTLIEMLVVVTIIGILVSISVFGLLGARENARDAKRKSDLETLRSGLELYKSDCGVYPATANFILSSATQLIGSGTPTSCAATNVYIAKVPTDTLSTQRYSYVAGTGNTTYKICAELEQTPSSPPASGEMTNCSCSNNTPTCNYVVVSP